MLSQTDSSIYSHHDAHHFTSTSHTHNLCIKTGKTRDKLNRLVFVAASSGVRAGTFTHQNLPDAYIFQVGYHQGYGLTGALPDDHNSIPQGYRRGDTLIAEFFRIIGPLLRPTFVLDANFVPHGTTDWLPTPKPAHRMFSDPCLWT